MRTYLYLLLSIGILTSCGGNQPKEQTDPEAASMADMHNSRTALDWVGRYTGVTPCADCEGIKTSLKLNQDGTYVLRTQYLGKSAEVNEWSGAFSWREDGNHIVLSGIEDGPSTFKVEENRIVQFDLGGNRITGGLADNYILEKAPALAANPPLRGTHWKIVEVNGKPVEITAFMKSSPFILLDVEEERMHGHAGCNNLMGGFELQEEPMRLSFKQTASTMMACPDMTLEEEFKKVLESTDNYSLSGITLTLNKARMAPLARLEAFDPEW